MTILIVPGVADATPRPSALAEHLPPDLVSTEHSARIALGRAGGGEQTLEVADDQVVEIELEDGALLWVRADDFARDLADASDGTVGRDAHGGGGTVRVPIELPFGTRSRGVGAWVIKGLKILGVDVAGSITEFVTERVEGKLDPGPGLYRCLPGASAALAPAEALDAEKPVLVFLHGTFSSTEGSFGGLWNEGEHGIRRLIERYDGQVLAFQHRTASESPIRNAVDLLAALDAARAGGIRATPWRLHLVSHSRGGLIGELLCRGTVVGGAAFDREDEALFESPDQVENLSALRELRARLEAMPPRIERFVRVACPARGTTLADGRLDRYLSGIVNVLKRTPGLGGPVFDTVSTLTLGVVRKRTEPRELPGLEAMMPSSPTIRLLNRPDVVVAADLHVIGGDVAKGGWNVLKVLLTDLYYREDHDLVVNTQAMLGGARRAAPVRHWIDQGSRVNHFRYFGNDATASRLFDALLNDRSTLFRTPDDVDPSTGKDYRLRAGEPLPIVFVLPGIMGSHLRAGRRRVWLELVALARGGIMSLSADAADVTPDGPIDDAYGDLLRELATCHDVRPFAYDWRRPIVESAALLERALEAALVDAEAHEQPIRFVAHSMGGLVVRAMLARPSGRALWRRACHHPGSRFLMLGTPNGGSHAIAAMLMGRDGLVRKLALLDLRSGHDDILRTVVGFDGVLQLLPHGGSLDLFDAGIWKRLREADLGDTRGLFGGGVAGSESSDVAWAVPDAGRLNKAAAFRDTLTADSLDPERTLYVAGVAPATASDVSIDEQAAPGRRVRVEATADGDGRVPWRSGIPSELPPENVYYLDAAHGNLAATRSAFPAILELLERGTTERLPRTPPVRRDIIGESFPLPPDRTDRFPDRDDLLVAALGGSARARERPTRRTPVRVRVVHGDLGRSEHPVLVGHHAGDTIASAEDYLDRQLGGRLRERRRLDVYPGAFGSALVVLNPREGRPHDAHPGAIVVGLGEYGELTPGKLIGTLARGMTEYAVSVLGEARERARRDQGEPPDTVPAPLTALLIGASSDLGVADSLQSILRAVEQTNQRLSELGRNTPESGPARREEAIDDAPPVQIDRLDIVECWEDRAVLAARAMRRLAEGREFATGFDVQPHLQQARDGRRRVCFDDRVGWWRRMRITADEQGRLGFESFAARGRVQSSLQPTQRRLVDLYLRRAVSSTRSDASLGRTLFELLIPNELKQYAPDRHRLVLVVDKTTAEYPWELLQDGADEDGLPMAVHSGVIRQLAIDDSRPKAVLAQSRSALVIGDPGRATDSVFATLQGARHEATQVVGQLREADYDAVGLIGDDVDPVTAINTLYERPYGVLHIAAHGVHAQPVDEDGRPILSSGTKTDETSTDHRVTGVVLGGGIYLTPAEISKRYVPQLVFLNCCHLGRIDRTHDGRGVQYHRLAASLATEFIRLGARAVIAAGWAVDDAAAALFAEVFYERMLGGETFGDAVLQARVAVHSEPRHRATNTWGAYQCYGDPDFTLSARGDGVRDYRDIEPIAATEMREEVDAMARRIGYAEQSEREHIREALERLVADAPEEWMGSGALCASLAEAWGELGDFKRASSFYDKARSGERADGSMASMEQLANLTARLAVERHRSNGADLAATLEALDEALRMIDALLGIGKTQERWSIKGSIHKRRVVIEPDAKTRKVHLEAMATAYRESVDIARHTPSPNLFYPLQNLVAARLSQSWMTKTSAKAGETLREEIDRGLTELNAALSTTTTTAGADFWTMCQLPDLRLLEALANGHVSGAEEIGILDAYDAARRRGGTNREMKTIVDHLDFFKTQLERLPSSKTFATGLRDALGRLQAAMNVP